jgi:hypothetical protein
MKYETFIRNGEVKVSLNGNFTGDELMSILREMGYGILIPASVEYMTLSDAHVYNDAHSEDK